MSRSAPKETLILVYAGCSTCRKALGWLSAQAAAVTVRPIVDEPPTALELARWIPQSGLPIRKWLNTSGQSYRAIGKAKIDAASDGDIARWLSADGKLVKRPVVVVGERVAVGFKAEAWAELFAKKPS